MSGSDGNIDSVAVSAASLVVVAQQWQQRDTSGETNNVVLVASAEFAMRAGGR